MDDASPMDPAVMPEWVEDFVVAVQNLNPIERNKHSSFTAILWLSDQLRTALADTRRLDWIVSQTIRRDTDWPSSLHINFEVSVQKPSAPSTPRELIDAAMSAKPSQVGR